MAAKQSSVAVKEGNVAAKEGNERRGGCNLPDVCIKVAAKQSNVAAKIFGSITISKFVLIFL